MSLVTIPTEIIEVIFSLIIPKGWNNRDNKLQYLRMRQTCHRLDTIVSRELARKINYIDLGHVFSDMNQATITWIFLTKIGIGEGCTLWPLSRICHAAQSLVDWKRSNGISDPDEIKYLRAACEVLVAHGGVSWSCWQLQQMVPRENPEERRFWNYDSDIELLCDSPSPRKEAWMVRVAAMKKALPNVFLDENGGDNSDSPDATLLAAGGLAIAAYLGDAQIVDALVSQAGVAAHARDEDFGNPLYAAAYAGHEDIVRRLVDAGAEVSGVGSLGSLGTPIEAAAFHGHLALVKSLRAMGARPRFSLHHAVKGGHAELVRYLLTLDGVDVNASDGSAEGPPLLIAILNDHRDITKQLLACPGIKSSPRDANGNTPLHFALSRSWADVALLLLTHRDVETVGRDLLGQTPLHIACQQGLDGVVERLLARPEVNPNQETRRGRTALFEAVRISSVAIVRMLLAHPDMDASLAPVFDAPLGMCACTGNVEIAKLLLARPEVLASRSTGRMAFRVSASRGYTEVARLVKDAFNVNVNDYDETGRTALQMAIAEGNTAGAKFILSLDNADPNIAYDGATPLMQAIYYKNTEVVRLLLARNDVNINGIGCNGTALCCAISYGFRDIVKMLLDHDGVDPSLRTPVRRDDVIIPRRNTSYPSKYNISPVEFDFQEMQAGGESPLALAARKNHYTIFRYLLERTPWYADVPDCAGRTPFWWACYFNNKHMVQMLYNSVGTDINRADNFGWTPLLVAVQKDSFALMQMLLQAPELDVNRASDAGWTPLHLAISIGKWDVVDKLLRDPRIDVTIELDGQTPMVRAVMLENDSVCTVLRNYERRMRKKKRKEDQEREEKEKLEREEQENWEREQEEKLERGRRENREREQKENQDQSQDQNQGQSQDQSQDQNQDQNQIEDNA